MGGQCGRRLAKDGNQCTNGRKFLNRLKLTLDCQPKEEIKYTKVEWEMKRCQKKSFAGQKKCIGVLDIGVEIHQAADTSCGRPGKEGFDAMKL